MLVDGGRGAGGGGVGVHTALTSLNHPVVQPREAVICDTCEGGRGNAYEGWRVGSG